MPSAAAGSSPGRSVHRRAAWLGSLGGLLALAAVAACNGPAVIVGPATAAVINTRAPQATWTPALSLTPADELTSTPLAGPLPTSGPTITPRATRAPTEPPPVTPCADSACAVAAQHFWLARPIPSGTSAAGRVYVDYVDRSYPYGSTQNDAREPHHGVEFFNGSGTPIIAAGAGTVVMAGDDQVVAFGPSTQFYGRLVVVELDQTYAGQHVFTLYGHMQSVSVAIGEHVEAGDALGLVGSTGVAIGPHLHFEVRVGENLYTATRNPELWLTPYTVDGTLYGTIAGRVVDPQGNRLPEVTVAIRPVNTQTDKPRNRFVLTYAADPQQINGDDRLQENFAIMDMPPGLYSVSVSTTKLYQQTLTVRPGELAFITFVVNPPGPRPTAAPVSDTPVLTESATPEGADETPTPEIVATP
ncbi:MAG: peptidoglycan DD-metalloendopeptidase family protein [Anaerolineales bacterium]|nr:peptidoglycan DD-metalloendopeptidase family protein [Anaerolineales bacterium]